MSGATATMERPQVDLLTAQTMLSYISPEGRDTWLQVGMGLKAEFGEAAFTAWDQWSALSDKYQPRAAMATWKSFKYRPGGYTIATVVKLAMQGGYTFERNTARVVSAEEVEARRRAREAAEAQAAAEREAAVQDAANRACETWGRAAVEGVSPYLVRKGITRPEGVRYSRDWLIVPMMRYDLPEAQALRGVQIIKPSGEKRFTGGMAKTEPYGNAGQTRGVSCALALPEDCAYHGPIMIAEGYATAASARAASGYTVPTFAAFDCGGLLPAARVVRALWPKAGILVLADDDYLTDGNPGVTKAKDAAQALKRATWMRPFFSTAKPREGRTDFNDLHISEGLGAVTAQLWPALDLIKRGRV